jgi:hypothetical protein
MNFRREKWKDIFASLVQIFSGTDGHTSVSGRRFADFRSCLHLGPKRYLNNRVPSSLRSTAASRREIFLADR